MKIGILTYFTDIPYFNDINPGMNLQAYSVYQAVREAYPDDEVEMIRFHSWFAIWRIYLTGITWESFKKDCRQFWQYYLFNRNHRKSRKALITMNYEKATRFFNSLGYDAIYVGSDTLLEMFRATQDKLTPYWLSPEVKAHKFMMAASARDASYGKLTARQRELMQASIDGFEQLGVRDEATRALISHFVEEKDDRLQLVPDPTFYLDIDYSAADSYTKRSGMAQCGKPIVCFHLLKTDTFADELAKMFHQKGWLVASLRPAKYADFLLKDLSPMEFAGIFRYFDLTITHRFHDSVFSIKNLTPFIVYPPSASYKSEGGHSKQSSLTNAFGLTDICLIEGIQKMEVSMIMERAMNAISEFNKRKPGIQEQLLRYKKQLNEYIQRTTQWTR